MVSWALLCSQEFHFNILNIFFLLTYHSFPIILNLIFEENLIHFSSSSKDVMQSSFQTHAPPPDSPGVCIMRCGPWRTTRCPSPSPRLWCTGSPGASSSCWSSSSSWWAATTTAPRGEQWLLLSFFFFYSFIIFGSLRNISTEYVTAKRKAVYFLSRGNANVRQ